LDLKGEWAMSMSWIYLLIAGAFEVCFTIGLKYSQGFTRFVPTVITVIFIFSSYFFVSLAMKTISIGTAYAVWAGIGAAGAVICGILFFGDSYHIIRLISLALIIVGIFGLKLSHID
jgi:quaternary ammonium compound-resistance protein SugE